jgi:hypothetical protein
MQFIRYQLTWAARLYSPFLVALSIFEGERIAEWGLPKSLLVVPPSGVPCVSTPPKPLQGGMASSVIVWRVWLPLRSLSARGRGRGGKRIADGADGDLPRALKRAAAFSAPTPPNDYKEGWHPL